MVETKKEHEHKDHDHSVSAGHTHGHKHHENEHEHVHEHHEHKSHKVSNDVASVKRKVWHKTEHKRMALSILAIILGIVIIVGITLGLSKSQDNSGGSGSVSTGLYGTKYGETKFDVYVMSQCPYGTQVEDAFIPVIKELGGAVNLNLDYIVTDLGGGNFRSLHGDAETKGNIAQLCAKQYDKEKYLDMILCMNKDARSIPNNWESCADSVGITSEMKSKISACYSGQEGKDLLSASAKRAVLANAQGSPTMLVNGKAYNGGRDALSFKRALCSGLDKHPACSGIPMCATDFDCPENAEKDVVCQNPNTAEAKCILIDPVEVQVTVLSDKNCKTCDTTRILDVTKQLFKGSVVKNVDISSEEGKKLAEENELVYLPVFFFDDAVTETNSWKQNPQLQGAFVESKIGAGNGYRIIDEATGASYFVSEEARKEYNDKLGLTTGDNRPQVDFFVMSYCPYGNQAEELLAPVYDLLGAKADFKPHYVIYSNYNGGGPNYCYDKESKYCSMHGIQELNQNIREQCVEKYMGMQKWFDFALAMNDACNSQNADTCWEGVATTLGLDKEKIKSCFETEALNFLEKDLELNKLMKVSGSPTLFFEGEQFAGARTSTGYAEALCAGFDSAPSECSNLAFDESAQTATNAAASQAQC